MPFKYLRNASAILFRALAFCKHSVDKCAMTDQFPCRSNCPINYALESFGDKWTLLIIRDLMFKSKQSFGEFLTSNEKISTNILTDRLKHLEAIGIITREVSGENRSKGVYLLTQKGKDLLPIMLEITQWSGRYYEEVNTSKEFLKKLDDDKAAVILQIKTRWEDAKKT